jgi:hypothetical protein
VVLRGLLLVGLLVAGGVPGSAVADDGRLGAHRLVLPEPRRAASGRDWADIDAAPGAPPTAAHRHGTVVVAEAMALEPSPSVTELDLADGTLVRSAALPLSAAFCELRIVRAGDTFHVVAAEGRGGRVVHVRLGRELAIESVETVGTGERPRLATDGAIVSMLWSGARDRASETSGWQLLTFDANGARLGEVRLPRAADSTYLFGHPLAVVGGHVFVALPGGSGPRVVQLSADARPERVHAIPWSADDGRLFVVGGSLHFTDNCRTVRVVDLSAPDAPMGEPTPLPGRPAGARACVAFEAATDASGSILTTTGELFDARFQSLRSFARPEGLVMRALWVHGVPALVVAGGPGGRASIEWSSENVSADDPAAETLLQGKQKR